MTRLLLIRHGQTAWNLGASAPEGERFRGQIDLPLNDTGHTQARQLSESLIKETITSVYSSPLQRAIDTAAPAADHLKLIVNPVKDLIDINYGKWQELPHKKVAEEYPDLYNTWLNEPHLARPPEGESLDEVSTRTMKALYQFIEEHEDETILVAGHQVINKVMVCAMLGLDNSHFWDIRQDNACLNIFDYDEKRFTTILINETCHLGDQDSGVRSQEPE